MTITEVLPSLPTCKYSLTSHMNKNMHILLVFKKPAAEVNFIYLLTVFALNPWLILPVVALTNYSLRHRI